LLDTTRSYGLQKLTESGELEALARRRAEYYRDLFEPAETESEVRPATEWLARFGRKTISDRPRVERADCARYLTLLLVWNTRANCKQSC
jgi:predicted ATPase